MLTSFTGKWLRKVIFIRVGGRRILFGKGGLRNSNVFSKEENGFAEDSRDTKRNRIAIVELFK